VLKVTYKIEVPTTHATAFEEAMQTLSTSADAQDSLIEGLEAELKTAGIEVDITGVTVDVPVKIDPSATTAAPGPAADSGAKPQMTGISAAIMLGGVLAMQGWSPSEGRC